MLILCERFCCCRCWQPLCAILDVHCVVIFCVVIAHWPLFKSIRIQFVATIVLNCLNVTWLNNNKETKAQQRQAKWK